MLHCSVAVHLTALESWRELNSQSHLQILNCNSGQEFHIDMSGFTALLAANIGAQASSWTIRHKKRKDLTFRRQLNETPSTVPGLPRLYAVILHAVLGLARTYVWMLSKQAVSIH